MGAAEEVGPERETLFAALKELSVVESHLSTFVVTGFAQISMGREQSFVKLEATRDAFGNAKYLAMLFCGRETIARMDAVEELIITASNDSLEHRNKEALEKSTRIGRLIKELIVEMRKELGIAPPD
jgi:hypothetical protein